MQPFARRWPVVRALLLTCICAVAAGALGAEQTDAARLGEGAPKRFAIVVGNADYKVAPDLRNAAADARLVAKFLGDEGYSVSLYTDLDKPGFETMLQKALFQIDKDSEVVFYFAGHGVQIAGANYLIPTDAAFDNPFELPFEAVSLTTIVNVLGARARTQVVIIDSCRANPFAGASVMADINDTLSETRDGFNVLTAPVNSLLAFSTSPGSNAWDGSGENSPFTAALIEAAQANPVRPVSEVLEEVRRQVYTRTNGLQVPWESSTLVQPVAFGMPTAGIVLAGAGVADAGARRSWMSVTMPQAAVINTRVASDGGGAEGPATIEMAGPLDHEVGVGVALAANLDLPPETPVSIAVPPERGRLLLALDDGRRVDAVSQPGLTAEGLQSLTYEPEPGQGSAGTASAGHPPDSFIIAAPGVDAAVGLALDPDPCDLAAGDHLDPDGVTPGKYPNEIDPATALPACEAAVQREPGVGRFHYELGRVQLAMLDFDAARASLERARDLGHARAWVALGLLITTEDARTHGQSGGPAPQAALDLYQQGVDAGDPYAIHTLGKELLRHGKDEEARRRGFRLLQQAVELGHTFAMNELGAYYMNPESPDSDPPRGLTYIQQSAARNDIYGWWNLGLVYEKGLAGVKADPQAAAEWLEKAADGGQPEAPGELGRLWNSGALGEKDRYENAVKWFDEGLARCDGWSGANAAWIIANQAPGGLVPRDAALRAASRGTRPLGAWLAMIQAALAPLHPSQRARPRSNHFTAFS